MKTKYLLVTAALTFGCLITTRSQADIFGSGGNAFIIDFVSIGNVGNGDDLGAGGGLYSSPYGGVPYNYRMGTFEISQDTITKATAGGLLNVTAGAWGASQPAANMTWYEMAAFVNFLNTSTGHQPAYNLNGTATVLTLWSSAEAWQAGGQNLFRHKDAFYFLPSEDEWYKAAFHKNDGVTANYWDYATGSNTAPTAVASGTGAGTVVFNVALSPAAVNNDGGLSSYGTRGQNGNAFEWTESAFDGTNDSPLEVRAYRGGDWSNDFESDLRSSLRYNFNFDPSSFSNLDGGFRVGSVPEPATVGLLGLGMLLLSVRRRRNI